MFGKYFETLHTKQAILEVIENLLATKLSNFLLPIQIKTGNSLTILSCFKIKLSTFFLRDVTFGANQVTRVIRPMNGLLFTKIKQLLNSTHVDTLQDLVITDYYHNKLHTHISPIRKTKLLYMINDLHHIVATTARQLPFCSFRLWYFRITRYICHLVASSCIR